MTDIQFQSTIPSGKKHTIPLDQIELAFSLMETDVDFLLTKLLPTKQSNRRRREVIDYISSAIRCHSSFGSDALVVQLFGSGSTAIRTYLPESDIDLVLCGDGNKINIFTVFNALCREVMERDVIDPNHSPTLTIRNVEFINARTKVAHCKVNNLEVDITVNQISSLSTAVFLEEVDKIIGQNHLFKRTLILIKAWCTHESPAFCGKTILGSRDGMFSSYAICVLVLNLFNSFHPSRLSHPFMILKLFLSTFAHFPWESHVLTMDGPSPIVSGPTGGTRNARSQAKESAASPSRGIDNNAASMLDQKSSRFVDLVEKMKFTLQPIQCKKNVLPNSVGATVVLGFPVRSCNIQDPVDANNNLGISVTRLNLGLISLAMSNGLNYLENRIRHHPCLAATRSFPNPVSMNNPYLVTKEGDPSRDRKHRLSIKSTKENQLVAQPMISSVDIYPPLLPTPVLHQPLVAGATYDELVPLPSHKESIIENSNISKVSSNHRQTSSHPAREPRQYQQSQHAVETDLHQFVAFLFPTLFELYVGPGRVRSDLFDHPLQSWNASPIDMIDSNSIIHPQPVHGGSSDSLRKRSESSGSSCSGSSSNNNDHLDELLDGDSACLWDALLKAISIVSDNQSNIRIVEKDGMKKHLVDAQMQTEHIVAIDSIDGHIDDHESEPSISHQSSLNGHQSTIEETSMRSLEAVTDSSDGDHDQDSIEDGRITRASSTPQSLPDLSASTWIRSTSTNQLSKLFADDLEGELQRATLPYRGRSQNSTVGNSNTFQGSNSSSISNSNSNSSSSKIGGIVDVDLNQLSTDSQISYGTPSNNFSGLDPKAQQKSRQSRIEKRKEGNAHTKPPYIVNRKATPVVKLSATGRKIENEVTSLGSKDQISQNSFVFQLQKLRKSHFVLSSAIFIVIFSVFLYAYLALPLVEIIPYLRSSGSIKPVKSSNQRLQTFQSVKSNNLPSGDPIDSTIATSNLIYGSGGGLSTYFEDSESALDDDIFVVDFDGMETSESPAKDNLSVQSASGTSKTRIVYHWVKLGDSISLGDDEESSGSDRAIVYGQYIWRKDSQSIAFHPNIKMMGPILMIRNATEKEAGFYECSLEHAEGLKIMSRSVIKLSKSPLVRTKPMYIELSVGSPLLLDLQFEGIPVPHFEWFKNGYPLSESVEESREISQQQKGRNVFAVDSVNRSHSGTYSCKLTNIAGSYHWFEATVFIKSP